MFDELRITADAVTTLREHLLQDDNLERIAHCRCAESRDALVVTAVDPVPYTGMSVMESNRCAAAEATDRKFLEECFVQRHHPLIVHSHPFGLNSFSGVDRGAMPEHTRWMTDLDDDIRPVFGVIDPSTLHVEQWDRDNETFAPLPVTIVGDWTLDDPVDTTASPDQTASSAVDTELYDRNIRCFLEDGQDRLADTHIAVVGCGGIGSLLTQQLAGLGIRKVTFIDPDRLEASNVPRIPQATLGDVGSYKVAVLQQQYMQQVPGSEPRMVASPVQEAAQYLQDVDLILGGLDRVTPRMWLNRYAVQHLTYYVDAGSRIDIDDSDRVTDMAAYVQTIAPGVNACFHCLDRDDTEQMRREHLSDEELEEEVAEGYIAETALTPEPAVIHLNGMAASLAVETVAKLVTGYDTPPDFLHYDGLQNDLARLSTHRNDHCYTCNEFLATGNTDNRDSSTTDEGLPLPDAGSTTEQGTELYRIPDTVTAFFANTD
ncbi:ThiF family adenylyltransferase [Haloterrigena sp. SYSU A121-1]|uniref:ThiF family adenylyltransferase n=1 Tax=Haloterrigena gelatinilytica TaxID=2741724 RepID=A0A8J8GK23_9EURY|nr:ThiF family adenylyltransferase [Haloterrigena gelatinilytica]NUB91101.1 ThiF family adenylyltransferase [Haloterrigena gelatinilytica]